jgi:hypothetical protein
MAFPAKAKLIPAARMKQTANAKVKTDLDFVNLSPLSIASE